MSKVYEKPCVLVMILNAQDLVTESLGFALGQDKAWADDPWAGVENGGENQ